MSLIKWNRRSHDVLCIVDDFTALSRLFLELEAIGDKLIDVWRDTPNVLGFCLILESVNSK